MKDKLLKSLHLIHCVGCESKLDKDKDRDRDRDKDRDNDSTEGWICASCTLSDACGGYHLLHKHVKSWRSKERGPGHFLYGIINAFDKPSGVTIILHLSIEYSCSLDCH